MHRRLWAHVESILSSDDVQTEGLVWGARAVSQALLYQLYRAAPGLSAVVDLARSSVHTLLLMYRMHF